SSQSATGPESTIDRQGPRLPARDRFCTPSLAGNYSCWSVNGGRLVRRQQALRPSGAHDASLFRYSDEVLNALFVDGRATGFDGCNETRCSRTGDRGIADGSTELVGGCRRLTTQSGHLRTRISRELRMVFRLSPRNCYR